jgi:predicted phosphoadenosine phosphosulfate sulfurtransferase
MMNLYRHQVSKYKFLEYHSYWENYMNYEFNTLPMSVKRAYLKKFQADSIVL